VDETVTSEHGPEARRPDGWTGEARVNLIRLAGLIAFYGLYLLKIYVFKDTDSVLPQYLTAFTALTVVWVALVLVVQVCLSRRWLPMWLKYAVVLLDTALVTVLLALVADPQSPLLVLYFLILASTPLRRSRLLVAVASLGAIVAYVCLLGYYIYVEIGPQEYAGNPVVKVPRALQIFMVLALAGAGFLASQMVNTNRMAPEDSKVENGRSASPSKPEKSNALLLGVGLLLLGVLTPLAGLTFVNSSSVAKESIFAPGARLKLEARKVGGEGPAWHPELGLLSSSEGGIWLTDRAGQSRNYRSDLGTCGLLFDAQGRLLACEGRRMVRIEPDGHVTVLTDRYQGMRYNNPNDLTVDGRGRIYFSDPRYGDRTDMEMRDEKGQIVEGVYRIDPDGEVTRIIGRELERPNGVLVSADNRYLYVADTNVDMGGARKLWRYSLWEDGTVDRAKRTLLYDWGLTRGADGLKQDVQGRLYVAAGLTVPHPRMPDRHKPGGVYVLSPEGQLLDFLPVPRDQVTNLAFGGDDLKTLYITAGGNLYSIRTTTAGRVVWPKTATGASR
jgi:gluconolactonase